MRNTTPASFVTALAFALGLTAMGRTAAASPSFPPVVASYVKSSTGTAIDQPDCILCHRDDEGGLGSVVRPFGISMQKYGAVQKSTDALKGALAGDDALKVDSDCDGVPDIAELQAGTDPNTGSDGKDDCGTATLTPAYGCGAHVAPDGNAANLSALFVAGALGLTMVRRRRR